MNVTSLRAGRQLGRALAVVLMLSAAAVYAQTRPEPAPAAPSTPPADALGRDTPRGTLLGFLTAARKGDDELARHYLNTPDSNRAAQTLAHQLFVVLDTRLPARLTQVSDAPDGSRANPLAPDEESVGTIDTPSGRLNIVIERVTRPKAEPIWLFSRGTLDAIPAAYAAFAVQPEQTLLPRFLTEWRIRNVRLFDWLAVLIGLPAFYFFTVLVNRALIPVMAWLGHRSARVEGSLRNALPTPALLLLLCLASRWLVSRLPFSLLVRQFLSNAATVIGIGALAWLVILLNGVIERRISRRVPAANYSAADSLQRAGRRMVDVIVLLAAVLAILRHFGVDATPLLAGLGVGGIAVALAAQKTLENVIAGASLIVDQAVRVGDYLKVGDLEGTVDHIGLRSTRIRTPGRSIVSVPNSQIANMSLETLSARDKFWLNPIVALRHDTTTGQLRAVLEGLRELLARHTAIDTASIRVRFLRLGAFSLDIEISAYVYAADWGQFLEIQEGLLLRVTEIVSAAGTAIALPSQTMYVSSQTSQEGMPTRPIAT